MTIRTALLLSFIIGAFSGAGILWVFGPSPKAPEPFTVSDHRPGASSEIREIEVERQSPTLSAACEPAASFDLPSERLEVERLKRELEKRLDALVDAVPSSLGRQRAEIQICRDALADVSPKVPPVKRLDRKRDPDVGFDLGALAESGIGAREIDGIRERWEEAKLEKLGLDDRKARGEDIPSEEEYAAIEWDMREDLGEEDYDAMLYATNQENRVALRGVLENSVAHRAGLRNGRVVHSCNGQRIFTPAGLLQCTSGGSLGEKIPIEMIANHGKTVQYWIERGPLGATEVVAVKFQPDSQ